MLAGIYYGAQYGGSTTAILVNIPGEATSVVTTLDGHQMAKQGRAGVALGIAAIGSFFAGTRGHDHHRRARHAAHQDGAAVRPRRLLLADGARPDVRRRAGARLGGQGHRRHPGRHPAVDGRHRPGKRRGAPDLRLERDIGRPRRGGAGHGSVRVRRDPQEPRDHADPRRRACGDRQSAAQSQGLPAGGRADRARHLPRLAARPAAGQRRRARPVCLLHAGEEARRRSLPLRQGCHRGRGRPGSRPTTPAPRRPSSRCSRSAFRPTP